MPGARLRANGAGSGAASRASAAQEVDDALEDGAADVLVTQKDLQQALSEKQAALLVLAARNTDLHNARQRNAELEEALFKAVEARDLLLKQLNSAIMQRNAVIAQRDAALGVSLEKFDDAELEQLKIKLQQTVGTVENYQLARAHVEEKHPSCCCPIGTNLMYDPVMTVEGISYSRCFIEQHFAKLKADGKPIVSPNNTPLESELLVPNLWLKNHILSLVEQTALEFKAAPACKRARK